MFGCYMLSSVLMILQSFILSWLSWVIVRILNDFAIILLWDSLARSNDILNNPMCLPTM